MTTAMPKRKLPTTNEGSSSFLRSASFYIYPAVVATASPHCGPLHYSLFLSLCPQVMKPIYLKCRVLFRASFRILNLFLSLSFSLSPVSGLWPIPYPTCNAPLFVIINLGNLLDYNAYKCTSHRFCGKGIVSTVLT